MCEEPESIIKRLFRRWFLGKEAQEFYFIEYIHPYPEMLHIVEKLRNAITCDDYFTANARALVLAGIAFENSDDERPHGVDIDWSAIFDDAFYAEIANLFTPLLNSVRDAEQFNTLKKPFEQKGDKLFLGVLKEFFVQYLITKNAIETDTVTLETLNRYDRFSQNANHLLKMLDGKIPGIKSDFIARKILSYTGYSHSSKIQDFIRDIRKRITKEKLTEMYNAYNEPFFFLPVIDKTEEEKILSELED